MALTREIIQVALTLGCENDLDAILNAIADLKDKATNSVGCVEVLAEKVELINAIAEMLGIKFTGNTDDIYEAIAKLQKERELAQLAAEGKNVILNAIAARLGVGFWGDAQTIFSAIHRLKLRAVNDDSECYRAVDSLDAIAKALGYEYVDSPQTKDTLVNAIANLKHSLELSQNEVDELREKSAIADQLQADLAHTDIGELRSERDYYRDILDKLCDRLNVPNIEALEHAAKYQEMDLDFTAQHNDDLREKLVTSQAMALKYMKRIVELENEVRSLQEPVPNTAVFLSTPELVQIIRRLLD